MEYFLSSKTVRLRSHNNKYLVADSGGGGTVKQSRNGQSCKAKWRVVIAPSGNKIRLMSSSHQGKYLAATDEPFLLGVTGRKVALSTPATEADVAVEWEPIREGVEVKLISSGSKSNNNNNNRFLKANRGPPPYKDSVTVDVPNKKLATKNWVLWTVDILETNDVDQCSELEGRRLSSSETTASSSSNDDDNREDSNDDLNEDDDDVYSVVSATTSSATYKPKLLQSQSQSSSMELFRNAKTVRLRSHHDKYLLADDDRESVFQDRHNPRSNRVRWTVEYVNAAGDESGSVPLVRLKSCFDRYLTATDEPFLLKVTGKKVVQSLPRRLDSSVEWEPIREGMQVKLKTRYGNFLRANGGLPPWRNSITHDVPSRTHTQDWILWDIEVLDLYPQEDKLAHPEPEPEPEPFSADWIRTPPNNMLQSSDSFTASPAKNEGRLIHYNVVDDDGDIIQEGTRAGGTLEIHFKGTTLAELKQILEEQTGLQDILVCTRNPLNGKLSPLRLALPPNSVKMHVFVLPSSSKVAGELGGLGIPSAT